ncbi:MAG: acyl-CoA thioesterase [Lachnospira sp.]
MNKEELINKCTYMHRVQYYETDQMGIVHHSNYIRWFEEARSYMLEQIGCGYKAMEEMNIISPVISVSAEYKSMTHYYDEVCIRIRILNYNGVKITLSYEITDKNSGELRCTGESSHCFLRKDGRPVSLKKSNPEIHSVFEEIGSLDA